MKRFEQLEKQVGSFGLAVMIYAQSHGADDPFWDSLNFGQWAQIFYQAPPQSQIAITATRRMEQLAEGFSQWQQLYFTHDRLNNTTAAVAARNKAVEAAATFWDWYWVLSTAGANMEERRHAISKMQEVGGTFENWQGVSMTVGKVALEQMVTIAEVGNTDKQWLAIYAQTATYGYADVAKTAVSRLDALYNFEQWLALSKKHWLDYLNYAGGTKSKLVGHAIKRMEELAATPEQCFIVHESSSDEKQKARMVEKLKTMDAPFTVWEKMCPGQGHPSIRQLALAKMVQTATSLVEWEVVYSYGNSDEQVLAIAAMARLTDSTGAQ